MTSLSCVSLFLVILYAVISTQVVALQEKRGALIELSRGTTDFAEWLAINSSPEAAPQIGAYRSTRPAYDARGAAANATDASPPRAAALRQHPMDSSKWRSLPSPLTVNSLSGLGDASANHQKRLVDDIFDPQFYDKNVHPVRNHLKPARINISMSLYQLLDVDEHSQSISVNVWMVENWYDEFLDWNPLDYGMVNRTIVPYNQIWIPDTYLYNSETLEQKKTESLMNAIVETGYWANDSLGARVQLMFPAIYRLSCRMDVQFFPYDQQNCTFIISSWTHDIDTIDYWPAKQSVNLRNMARNDEWEVISFEFERVEEDFKCCKRPWAMVYAHLVIKRKPLYYIVNLVIPTSIITVVAVTGFFTPTSSSSERDEKLYLGINTLLTMSIMMLMVCNQMPSTSTYVPLLSWYYMGIIGVIVTGTLLATLVLAIHGQKHYMRPLSKTVRRCVHNWLVNTCILEVPTQLLELWMEYGIVDAQRKSTTALDPLLAAKLDPETQLPPEPAAFIRTISSEVSQSSLYSYERRLASITRQYTAHMRRKQSERAPRLAQQPQRFHASSVTSNGSGARDVKRQKMMRSLNVECGFSETAPTPPKNILRKLCALEWEYLANVLDRVLLTIFISVTACFFLLLVFFDDVLARK